MNDALLAGIFVFLVGEHKEAGRMLRQHEAG